MPGAKEWMEANQTRQEQGYSSQETGMDMGIGFMGLEGISNDPTTPVGFPYLPDVTVM